MIPTTLKKVTIHDLDKIRNTTIKENTLDNKDKKFRIIVHLGTCGIASGAEIIKGAVEDELKKRSNKNILFTTSGCVGFCILEPMLTVEQFNREPVIYHSLDAEKVKKIFDSHIDRDEIVSELEPIVKDSALYDFYKYQEPRVLRNRGRIDPFKITDYIAMNGYQGLAKAIEINNSDQIIKTISESGLKGRGGAGFLTGKKWELCKKAVAPSRNQIYHMQRRRR